MQWSKQKFYSATVASLLLIFTTPAFAKRDGRHLEKLSKELGLTTEQQEQVKAVHAKGAMIAVTNSKVGKYFIQPRYS